VPYVGEKSVVLIPNDFDNYLSNQFLINYLAENKVDTVKSEWLTHFGNALDLKNEKELGFVVVESDIVNAFALPDGKIVVFTGIIDKVKSYDELAALLAHEAAHINGRHSVKMLARNLAGYIFVSAMFSDVNGIMAVIAENAESLQSLSYSRKFENEADREGVYLLLNNNIQPEGMVKLFSRLKDDENVLPVFLSTHPVTDDRIQTISGIIKQTQFEIVPNSKLDYYFNKLKNAQ
jgi:predicted Zn-dependent protease